MGYSCKMCKRKVLKPKKMKMAKRVVPKVGGYCSTPGGYRSCKCRKKRGLPCLKKKKITAKKISGKKEGKSLHKMLHIGHHTRKKIQAKHGLYVIGKRIKRIYSVFKHLKKAKAMSKTSKSLSKAMAHHAIRACEGRSKYKEGTSKGKEQAWQQSEEGQGKDVQGCSLLSQVHKGQVPYHKGQGCTEEDYGFPSVHQKEGQERRQEGWQEPKQQEAEEIQKEDHGKSPKAHQGGGLLFNARWLPQLQVQEEEGIALPKEDQTESPAAQEDEDGKGGGPLSSWPPILSL